MSFTEVFSSAININPSSITALSMWAKHGDLISINEVSDKRLLRLGDAIGRTPLHYTCLCLNAENGYLAAKKLIQLGSPINLVKKFERKDHRGNIQIDFSDTPLEFALRNGAIKIAALLLRLEGIARPELFYNKEHEMLDDAKKEIMTCSEKLFKLGIAEQNVLPNEVVDFILLISAKLI